MSIEQSIATVHSMAARMRDENQRLRERLDQARDHIPFHYQGHGTLAGECLRCGELFPCEGYAREVGDQP